MEAKEELGGHVSLIGILVTWKPQILLRVAHDVQNSATSKPMPPAPTMATHFPTVLINNKTATAATAAVAQ